MRLSRDDFRRYGSRFYSLGIGGMPGDPDTRFETFRRERSALGQAVLEFEARTPAGDDSGFDTNPVAETRRQQKSCARFRHRVAEKIVHFEIFVPRARSMRTVVETSKISK